MKPENNFIYEFNLGSKVCDDLIEWFESEPKKQNLACHPLKNCIERSIWEHEYFTLLDKPLNEYKLQYPYCDKYQPAWALEEAIVQKYRNENECFGEVHWEATYPNAMYRNLVFMTYLNDVSEGGETEFPQQNIKFKPKKGLTLIWPPFWTHAHRGLPSKEVKYIITGWLSFVDK